MMDDVYNLIFGTWYSAFIGTFLFFNIIYWGLTFLASNVFGYFESKSKVAKVDNHFYHQGQLKKEKLQSMRSIFIFSVQGILIQQGLARGWFHIQPEISWWLILEITILFLWNEVHFYLCHLLLHTKIMMRNFHHVHHHSKEPTLFSTFSFHAVEAFLLGTVVFFPLVIYAFQLLAIFSLPVVSLIINLLGHSNYDFFSEHHPKDILKFSYRHSMHHKLGKGNLGFLLPWLDQLFKTSAK